MQDRITTGAICARAGIREYWIVNVRDGRLEVFRAREGGRYTDRRIHERGETREIAALPAATVPVDDLLPRR